jgi:hypothetical protein
VVLVAICVLFLVTDGWPGFSVSDLPLLIVRVARLVGAAPPQSRTTGRRCPLLHLTTQAHTLVVGTSSPSTRCSSNRIYVPFCLEIASRRVHVVVHRAVAPADAPAPTSTPPTTSPARRCTTWHRSIRTSIRAEGQTPMQLTPEPRQLPGSIHRNPSCTLFNPTAPGIDVVPPTIRSSTKGRSHDQPGSPPTLTG